MCCNDKNHEHSHKHEHCHEHTHTHEHEHHDDNDCKCCEDLNLSKDEKTLRVLLVHWINHNKSHQDNFMEWVEKCNHMEKEVVGNYIKEAVAFMDKANEMLIEAKKHM